MPADKSILKDIIPSKGFGNPKTSPCGESIALPQLMNGFKLQGRSASGFFIREIVSSIRKKKLLVWSFLFLLSSTFGRYYLP